MSTAEFDKVIDEKYAFRYGENKLVFIKTGKGGTVRGHEDKYLKLSEFIHENFGWNVIVSANPLDSKADLEKEIEEVAKEITPVDRIYYIGMSDGALVGA